MYHDHPVVLLRLMEKLSVLLSVEGFGWFCWTEGSVNKKISHLCLSLYICLFVFYPIISNVLTWWTERWPHRVQHCESFHSSLFQWDGKTRFSFPPTKYNNSSINIWLITYSNQNMTSACISSPFRLSCPERFCRHFVHLLWRFFLFIFCKTITLVVKFF